MLNEWIVLKFGGNSVADLSCWQTIAEITRQHLAKQLRPLIVCSALAGVTTKLEKLLVAAVKGAHEEPLQEIITSYEKLATELSLAPEKYIKNEIAELSRLVTGLSFTQEVTPSLHAK